MDDNTQEYEFNCPHCGQPLAAEQDMAGMELECPACGKPLVVPQPPAKTVMHLTPKNPIHSIRERGAQVGEKAMSFANMLRGKWNAMDNRRKRKVMVVVAAACMLCVLMSFFKGRANERHKVVRAGGNEHSPGVMQKSSDAMDAQIESETVKGISWTYTVNNGESRVGAVTSANGHILGRRVHLAVPRTTSGSITIPRKLGGHPVTSIASCAFQDCVGLTSVKIPDSVMSIGHFAFQGCVGLTSVIIGKNVKRIGSRAFSKCSGLASLTIPNGVVSIEDSAFQRCSSLTSVTIPGSVTSIGDWAFADCSSLTSVTIPDSVTSIGKWAFSGCDNLKSKPSSRGESSSSSSTVSSSSISSCQSSQEEQAKATLALMALAAMAGQMNANQAQQPQPQMQNSGQQMGGGYFQMESGDYLQQRLDEQQRQIEQLKRQQQQGQSNSGRLVNCPQCGGSGRTAPDGSPILNPALNQRPVPCQRCRGTGAISEPFRF